MLITSDTTTHQQTVREQAVRLVTGLQILLGLALLLIHSFANAAFPAASVTGPQMFFDEGEEWGEAPVLSADFDIEIRGTSAIVTLKQAFSNPNDAWVNAVYAMPLPEGAAVRRMELLIADRRVSGEIKEKIEAQVIYEEARQNGQRAALLEHQRSDLFTTKVANIGPEESVVVELEYLLPVTVIGNQLRLQIPTTVMPRYESANSAARVITGPSPDWRDLVKPEPTSNLPLRFAGADSDPAHPMSVTVRLVTNGKLRAISAPLHEMKIKTTREGYEVFLANGVSEMNRDFVLQWQYRRGTSPTPMLTVEKYDGEVYAELNLMPPSVGTEVDVTPRELVLVLDKSGSMDGGAMIEAKAAALVALETLVQGDRFNVVTFSHVVTTLFEGLEPAGDWQIDQAKEFIEDLYADGGTEMIPALQAALLQGETSPGYLRQLLFVTDGAVYEEVELYQMIANQLGDARLFTVSIGTAPNSAFMRRAAEIGRGLHRQISSLDEVGPTLQNLMRVMATPVLTDVEIQWPAAVDLDREIVPDLYEDELLTQRAKFNQLPTGGLVEITGNLAGWPWRAEVEVPAHWDLNDGQDVMGALWARSKVTALQDKARLADVDEAFFRDEILALGLAHKLVTPFTSFVAVEEEIARPPQMSAGQFQVPHIKPSMRHQYAQTATNGPLFIYLGAFLGFLSLFIWAMTREETTRD